MTDKSYLEQYEGLVSNYAFDTLHFSYLENLVNNDITSNVSKRNSVIDFLSDLRRLREDDISERQSS